MTTQHNKETTTMTTIDPGYPPPAPPPPRSRRAALLLGASVALAIGSAIAVIAVEETTGPAPSSSAASLERWVLEHGDEAGSVMGVVQGIASDIADTATTGDVLETLDLCADGAQYLAEVSVAPVTLDSDAPDEWTRTISLWRQGFDACVDGEFDIASDYVARGTDAIRDLTDMMRAL